MRTDKYPVNKGFLDHIFKFDWDFPGVCSFVRINHIPTLDQIMAWCLPGTKPLTEAMMVNLLMHVCVTRPQWDKQSSDQFGCECVWYRWNFTKILLLQWYILACFGKIISSGVVWMFGLYNFSFFTKIEDLIKTRKKLVNCHTWYRDGIARQFIRTGAQEAWICRE